jgi:hypothetical protein
MAGSSIRDWRLTVTDEGKPGSVILKAAAGQRQLDAAIRMWLAGEDILAITTVASAAYRVLRDIHEHAGRRVLAEEWKTDIVGVARALVRGDLSEREIAIFKEDRSWVVIESLAHFVRDVGADQSMEALCAKVTLDIPPEIERAHWSAINLIPNFLKHADSDPAGQIFEEGLDPRLTMLRSCMLYSDLMGALTPEMQVWYTLELSR